MGNKKYLKVFISNNIVIKKTKKKRVMISFSTDNGQRVSLNDTLLRINDTDVCINVHPVNKTIADKLVAHGYGIWCMHLEPNEEIIDVENIDANIQTNVTTNAIKEQTMTITNTNNTTVTSETNNGIVVDTSGIEKAVEKYTSSLENIAKEGMVQYLTAPGSEERFTKLGKYAVLLKHGLITKLKFGEEVIKELPQSAQEKFNAMSDEQKEFALIGASNIAVDLPKELGLSDEDEEKIILEFKNETKETKNVSNVSESKTDNKHQEILEALEKGRFTCDYPKEEEEEESFLWTATKTTAKVVAIAGLAFLGYRALDAIFGDND